MDHTFTENMWTNQNFGFFEERSKTERQENLNVTALYLHTNKFVCLFYLLLSKAHLDFSKDSNTNITCLE